jgi:thymidylate synthase ThyX
MAYEDAKHRPHAIHTGEVPKNPITYGPESLSVRLDRWGPVTDLFTSMYDALQSNWGDAPSRTVLRRHAMTTDVELNLRRDDRVGRRDNIDVQTGWVYLSDDERDYVEACFAGKTLQQVLEGVTFDFCIDGVARVFTHQNVRTRLGAGFMQHGGRDNDWRHRPWTMPETIRRASEAHALSKGLMSDAPIPESVNGLRHCISDWSKINDYLYDLDDGPGAVLGDAIAEHLMAGRQLYSALVDAGIPWQDARRVLTMGTQTYIHDQYNYLALSGVLANRLEHIMDWEFNCVAQLMLREIKMKCPPLISKYLGSHSDKAKAAKFAGLESWPPDGKWPNPYERCGSCGHARANHNLTVQTTVAPMQYDACEVCVRQRMSCAGYVGVDTLDRQHRPEQMPFFVLHPTSMEGGPIVWIPTNGTYPHDVLATETK